VGLGSAYSYEDESEEEGVGYPDGGGVGYAYTDSELLCLGWGSRYTRGS